MSQRPLGSIALHRCLPLRAFLVSSLFSLFASGFSAFAINLPPAHQQMIAVSGDLPPTGAGISLRGLSAGTLNNQGEVVFIATLAEGIGGVDSTNDAAVWRFGGGAPELIARTGMGDLGGASFSAFNVVSIADDGDVVFRAGIDQNRQGFWRVSSSGATVPIVTTGGGPVAGPGLGQAVLTSVDFPLFHAPSDQLAYSARLAPATAPSIPSNTVRGAWLDANGVGSLIARERITDVPDLPGNRFFVPSVEGVNNSGQIALLGSMVANLGDATPVNTLGIWRIGPAGGKLIARRGVGDVAGVPDASYFGLSELRINSAGQMAFVGELELAGAVTAQNNRGIWRFDGAGNSLVARTGAAAPGVAGALFHSLDAPLLNDAGQILFSGGMQPGVGSVTTSTARGIWIAGADGAALVARTGVGGVPGLATARFAEFNELAFNGDGVTALNATLETGSGGVAPGTEQGLWLMDAAGDGSLIARAGDLLAERTIASVSFTAGSGGGDGRQRSLNEYGQFLYKATFTNGDEGLFLYTPALKWRAGGLGAWDDSTNWTLGIMPAAVHEIDLSPHVATTVAGPAFDATVKKLTLGDGSGEATLELAAGSELTVTDGLQLGTNGRLSGKGTLVGAVVNAGATSPGMSAGVLAIAGDYVQLPTGRLSIELGGVDNSSPLQAEFDQLLVFGAATLAGTLEVSLMNGFVPAIGDTFEILRATGGLTAFDAYDLPTLPGDRQWSVLTGADAMALSVVAAAPISPADFDRDGDVDADDLQAWKDGFGAPATGLGGDANGDAVVDGNDFLVWQREFTGRLGGNAAVPEPAALPLAGFALAAIAAASNRSRRRR